MADSEELSLSYKSWKRSVDPIEKDGFREGFEKGRGRSYQEGFNLGFKYGFQYAYKEGIDIGKTRLVGDSNVRKIEDINGVCIMCPDTEEVYRMDLEEIIENQQKK